MSEVIAQPMRTGGAREDRPRNVTRCFVDIDCASSAHVVCGHKVSRGANRIEVYTDELDFIMGKVRSPTDVAMLAQIDKVYKTKVDRWMTERLPLGTRLETLDDERRNALLMECAGNEDGVKMGDVMADFGYRTGFPPFHSAARVDGDDIPAPDTVDNRIQRSNENLAKVIKDAIHAGSGDASEEGGRHKGGRHRKG